jgi:hypothetical protein
MQHGKKMPRRRPHENDKKVIYERYREDCADDARIN